MSASPEVVHSDMSTSASQSRQSAVSEHRHRQRHPIPMSRKVENLTSPKIMSGSASGTPDPIRARYLQSLNILLRPSSELTSATNNNVAHNVPPQTSKLDKIHHEALKRDYGQVDEDLVSITSNASATSFSSSATVAGRGIPTSPIPSYRSLSSLISSSSSSDDLDRLDDSPSSGRRRRGVSFDATVTVKSIPKRNEYSDRIRRHLWTSPEEMHHNAERNAVEFASEYFDWHRAVEDADMYVNVQTGEKIHPVHYERYLRAMEAKKKSSSSKSSSSGREMFLNQSRTKSRNSRNSHAPKARWSRINTARLT
jgi:hypothetical protein